MMSEGVDSIARRLGQPYLGFGILTRSSLSCIATATPKERTLDLIEENGECGEGTGVRV